MNPKSEIAHVGCRAGGAPEGVSRRAPVNRRGGAEEGVKRSALVRGVPVNRGVCRAGGAQEGVSRRAPVKRSTGHTHTHTTRTPPHMT